MMNRKLGPSSGKCKKCGSYISINHPRPCRHCSKSSFYDLPQEEQCNDLEHNPPTNLYIPPGKGYKHVCPGCGKTVNIVPPQIKF